MKHFVRYIILYLVIFATTACSDELADGTFIGEGQSVVSATLDFKPMSSALAQTRASGDALKDISSLHVLLYDYDTKELKKSWKLDDYAVSDENRTDADADNGHKAESKTKRATFMLPENIDFGRYCMYAVANIPDLFEKYPEAIKTVDGLKGISLVWNSKNVAANGQMIGHFTSINASDIEDDELLVINKRAMNLHAWLRRAASKVTVAFDGTNLKDNVTIYIMAVSIKDIPRTCLLGQKNEPNHIDSLIHEGEVIKYFDDRILAEDGFLTNDFMDKHKAFVTNKPPTQTLGSNHSETDEALFFYENMQGEGKDKRQTAPGPGNDNGNNSGIGYPNPDKDVEGSGWKDDKHCGTYIEVYAVYKSENPERPGTGTIKYRFMLGKDIISDYNAERNHHYKLTLKFNNFANDYDWHIEYKEQVLEVTEPKVMNYQGKVFDPDFLFPNLGHDFTDGSTVTVTSYIEDEEDKIVRWNVEYDEDGDGNYKNECTWLKYDILDGNVPYEKKVIFKVKEVKPDEVIDIDDNLSRATSKGTKENPYNLASPDGAPDKIVCTANCYMIDAPGWYIFPLVYGNAIHDGKKNENSYTYTGGSTEDNILKRFRNHLNKPITSPYIKENAGCNPQKAYLVWQDVDGLLRPSYTWETDAVDESPTYLADAYNKVGGIRFYVDGAKIKQGNALIAISDKAPEKVNEGGWKVNYPAAIWSWHIWITRFDYEESDKAIEVTAHDTSRKFEFMPVNLGWCSEANEKIKYYKERKCKIRFTAGSKTREITIVKKSHIATTRGNNPCYQWGRKDPFIAAIGDNFANKPRWNYIGFNDINNPPRLTDDSYGSDDTKRMTTREALHLLIQKPDTWHNPPRTETGNNDIPYVSNNKTYANLWEGRPGTDPNATILKTIYDPCPVGYQVSHYNAFTGFTTTGNNSSYWPQWFDVQIQNIADYNPTTGACGELGEYSNNLYEFYTNSGKYQSIIFPLTGYRDWDAQANTYHFNKIGYIWAAGNVKNDDNNSYNFEFARDDGGNKEDVDHSYVRPKNTFFPCDGFPIRPCRNGKHGLVP